MRECRRSRVGERCRGWHANGCVCGEEGEGLRAAQMRLLEGVKRAYPRGDARDPLVQAKGVLALVIGLPRGAGADDRPDEVRFYLLPYRPLLAAAMAPSLPRVRASMAPELGPRPASLLE